MERKVMGNNSRPQKEQALNCPRCQSTNTKFCYYNNYSLTQPRYFCKTCRRYWTEGGTLRNVPVGGGSRKNKLIRSSSSSSSSSSTTTNKINIIPAVADHHQHQEFSSHQNPYNYYKILHDSSAGQDLNLGFPTAAITPSFAALEILRSTSGGGGGGADLNNTFIIPPPPPPTTANATTLQAGGGGGFTFHDLKPTSTTTTTTVSSYMSRYGGGAASGDNEMMINQENSGRLMFPLFGAMTQVSGSGGTTTEVDADQNSNYGYNWDGMMLGTRSSGASW